MKRMLSIVIRVLILAIISVQSSCNSPNQGNGNFPVERNTDIGLSFPLDIDLSGLFLTPGDMTDFFENTSYSIQQAFEDDVHQGLSITYPTRVLDHTSAFVEGFSTQIKIFTKISYAEDKFNETIKNQRSQPIEQIEPVGNIVFFIQQTISAEGFEVDSFEHLIIIQQENAYIMATIRSSVEINSDRLRELAILLSNRLAKTRN